MCYQLVYRSETLNVSDEDIGNILKVSRKNNELMGITGCLIFRNNFFLQILEGERDKVKDLYYTIEDDIRHDYVKVLYEGYAQGRIFSDWDMAFLDLDEKQNSERLRVKKDEFDGFLVSNDEGSFGLRVFWYNIQQLLSRKGFYSAKFDRH